MMILATKVEIAQRLCLKNASIGQEWTHTSDHGATLSEAEDKTNKNRARSYSVDIPHGSDLHRLSVLGKI